MFFFSLKWIISTVKLEPLCVCLCSPPGERWAGWWRAWRQTKTLSPTRTAASAKTNSSRRAATAYQRGPPRQVSTQTSYYSFHTAYTGDNDMLIDCVVSLCPAPVQCVLDKDSLVDGLRVLIPMDDQLLYAGHVNTVHSPDMWVHTSRTSEGEKKEEQGDWFAAF